ncbi:MAG TPA: hypothetical protein DDX86_06675 [Akkermansia sp.]|nr:hypothetical protein [Akkermansia sp.]
MRPWGMDCKFSKENRTPCSIQRHGMNHLTHFFNSSAILPRFFSVAFLNFSCCFQYHAVLSDTPACFASQRTAPLVSQPVFF